MFSRKRTTFYVIAYALLSILSLSSSLSYFNIISSIFSTENLYTYYLRPRKEFKISTTTSRNNNHKTTGNKAPLFICKQAKDSSPYEEKKK